MILGIGYDSSDQLLEIEFRNGKTYRYHLVPRSVYTEFCGAPSPGDFFLKRIRSRYPFRQVS
jgi:KTSC domain